VDLVVPGDYAKLTKMLLVGEIDFANLPPLQFVLARHQDPKLEVVVTQTYEKARRYQAYLVVRDDSPITAVEEVRGKRFCYVDRGSASGYLLPRYFLRKKGLDPDKVFAATRFSGTHVAALKDIVAGRCDVGGVYSGAMLSAHTLGVAASRLRMLAVVAQIPYDVICASPRMPPKLVQKLRRALLQMEPQRDLGRKIVGPTFRIDGFVEPSLEEFAHVEQAARAEGLLR
jgi:phosphonate transport system substrate-binding protein